MLHKWVLCICVSMICGTIFYMLIPGGGMKKFMKLILNLFLVSSLAMPFIKNSNCLNIISCFDKINKNIKKSECYSDNFNKMDEKNLQNALKIVLMKNGYNCVDISIDINKYNSSDTGVYLKIPKHKKYDVNNIKQIVEKETGLNPKVVYYQ